MQTVLEPASNNSGTLPGVPPRGRASENLYHFACIGVYSQGRILRAKGDGLANIELNVPVKPETIFQSSSIGKQCVSTAIMMLVEEGKLSIDESVTKYSNDCLLCSSIYESTLKLDPGS